VRLFDEVIETMRAEEATTQRLLQDPADGWGLRSARRSPDYGRRLLEAANLVADVYEGRRPAYRLTEALGTGDFPLLFGDIIDRQLLGRYNETTPSYPLYCRVDRTIPDFRTVKRFAIDGSEAVLGAVLPGDQYPESKVIDAVYSYAVGKYGRRISLEWETLINDDLGAFRTLPDRLARSARRSEEKFATQLFVDVNGPHASMFTTGNKNIINATNAGAPFTAVNPALSTTGLQQGFAVLANQRDADGEPIEIDAVTLVVPPALRVLAENILSGTEIWITGDVGGGTTNQQLHAANWMRNKTTLAVATYHPIVATTANGNASWYLFASVGAGRPALEMGFLRGHDTPEMFIKDSDAMRAGGGAASPMDGDFDTDSIMYKIRHVFGGARIDPKMAVASNGSGA
jgi:hypothetical protein